MIELLHTDCMNYMKTCKDKQFDLAICDIPYGLNVGKMAYTQEVKNPVRQKNGNKLKIKNKQKYTLKDWDLKTPPQEYFDELKRISKHQIIFGIGYTNWIGVGKGRIIWDKMMPEGLSFNRYEIAYCSMIRYTKEIKLLWAGMQQAKSLNEPTISQGNKKLNEKRIHPCHKPTLLYKSILLLFAKNGYNIIDTHLGGASIAVAVQELNDKLQMDLQLVGCEIDKEYFDKSIKRMDQYNNALQLF